MASYTHIHVGVHIDEYILCICTMYSVHMYMYIYIVYAGYYNEDPPEKKEQMLTTYMYMYCAVLDTACQPLLQWLPESLLLAKVWYAMAHDIQLACDSGINIRHIVYSHIQSGNVHISSAYSFLRTE